MDKKKILFNNIVPFNMIGYVKNNNFSGSLSTMIIHIRDYYYFTILPSKRKYYEFYIDVSSFPKDEQSRKWCRKEIINYLSKEFNFINIYKKELIILKIVENE